MLDGMGSKGREAALRVGVVGCEARKVCCVWCRATLSGYLENRAAFSRWQAGMGSLTTTRVGKGGTPRGWRGWRLACVCVPSAGCGLWSLVVLARRVQGLSVAVVTPCTWRPRQASRASQESRHSNARRPNEPLPTTANVTPDVCGVLSPHMRRQQPEPQIAGSGRRVRPPHGDASCLDATRRHREWPTPVAWFCIDSRRASFDRNLPDTCCT